MASKPLSSAYAADLAYVHDVGFGAFADNSAPGLLDMLNRAGLAGRTVVDLGCGSGIWARHLTDAGHHVFGVDISPAMIELARKRAPKAEFHVGSFLAFELPVCGAVTALGEVVCYAFDRVNNFSALRRVFRRIFDALEPGGLLIFDVAEVGLDRDRQPTWKEGDDWACLVRFEHVDRRDQLVRHIVTFRRIGSHYRRHEESHRVQLYRRSDVAAMLRRAGFRVRTVRRYGEYDLPPGRIGFIARKL